MAQVIRITFNFVVIQRLIGRKNPVLAEGKPCVTLDGDNAVQIKIGDGVTPYSALA